MLRWSSLSALHIFVACLAVAQLLVAAVLYQWLDAAPASSAWPFSLVRSGTAWHRSENCTPMSAIRPQFVLFGDSITQKSMSPGGWSSRLADAYCRKADVVLRGYSGYNLVWAQYLLDKVFPANSPVKPALATVFFGANDATLPDGISARQHVPVDEYKRLLRKTVQHLQACGVGAVIIITPPPIDEDARRLARFEKHGVNQQTERPERSNSVTGTYAEAGRGVSKDLGVPVLDVWTEFQKSADWRGYLSDGLHLTPNGNEALFQLLQQLIDQELPQLRFEALPYDFPLHDDIDGSNPAAAFPSRQS